MKIDFKKLKEQHWKKTLADLIILGTLSIGGILCVAFTLLIVYLLGCALYGAYSASPSSFHWLFGCLVGIATWTWAWDWANKQ